MARKKYTEKSASYHWFWWVSNTLLFNVLFVSMIAGQPFAMDTISWSGPVDQRINLVFLGDGYQISEFDKYIEDVNRVVNHFFDEPPFLDYRTYFNIVAIKVPSNVSGAKRNPDEKRDTYFQATYGHAGIDRLLVAQRSNLAREILFEQFPLFHQAVLIVNDDKYGGSGGWLATTSAHNNSPEIALHEIGHSFSLLADEYWAGDTYAYERANMTREKDRTKVRWKNWLDLKNVGVFPHRENFKWYRPHQGCKMRKLNRSFCPVCKEALVKTIHELANPIIDFTPDTMEIEVEDSISFNIQTLKPQPNTLQETWLLNGIPLWQIQENYTLLRNEISADTSARIEVIISDTTPYVRDEEHRNSFVRSISWDLTMTSTVDVYYSSLPSDIDVFPNPTTDYLHISIPPALKGPFSISVIDISGLLLDRERYDTNELTISLKNHRPGSYYLHIYSPYGSTLRSIIKR